VVQADAEAEVAVIVSQEAVEAVAEDMAADPADKKVAELDTVEPLEEGAAVVVVADRPPVRRRRKRQRRVSLPSDDEG
jgi:hypothetical protein